MTRTSADSRTGWRAPLIVLGPLALAALATGAGADAALLGPLWLAAVAWTVLASLAGALGRGLRHGDWSAFGRYRLPDDSDDRADWVGRTGAYAYLRHEEDRLLHEDDDWLR